MDINGLRGHQSPLPRTLVSYGGVVSNCFKTKLFSTFLMILGRQKMHSPGALARRGGAPVTGLATPRLRTGCVVFVCHRTRGPLWAEWTIPRMCAREGWGFGGREQGAPRTGRYTPCAACGRANRDHWLDGRDTLQPATLLYLACVGICLRTKNDNSGCQAPI